MERHEGRELAAPALGELVACAVPVALGEGCQVRLHCPLGGVAFGLVLVTAAGQAQGDED
jgi:hypothetical protein